MSYYDFNAEKFFNSTCDLDLSDLYKPFLSLVKKNGKILDAGCGSGRDANYFKSHGYEVTAFDSSPELAKLGKEKFGIDIKVMSFQDLNYQNEYDGIWACASLLHIKIEHFPIVFQKISDSLVSNGAFYCSFKYGDEEVERDGRLFTNLNIDLLKAHIEKTSLSIYKIWISEDIRPGRNKEKWLNGIFTKKSS